MSYIGNIPTNQAFVTDTFNGDGTTTAFTMSVAPASSSSILVAVTGVLQSPSTYSVSGTTLTFSAAPPSGTGNISVRYLGIPASGVTTTAYRTVTEFTATAGQTSFSVPSYTVGYIDVYRNGARLGAADFTATTGTTVVLANACNAGDLVVTESFYVSSVLNAIPATAGAVNSTYIANGAVGSSALASGAVSQSSLGTGVAGTGPAFLAYSTIDQSITNNSATKVVFGATIFDTNSCFSTVNSRFTPNVAGYYQFTFSGQMDYIGSATRAQANIYKNGANYLLTEQPNNNSASTYPSFKCDGLVYLNGTTDYVEIYVYQNSGGNKTLYYGVNPYTVTLSGVMVRAA